MNKCNNRPKCGPIHFLPKSIHNVAQTFVLLLKLKKLPKVNNHEVAQSGTDVVIFEIFSPKNRRKNGVFDSKQS
jgi:hypothetical protein